MHGESFKFEKEPDNDMWIGPNGCHYDSQAEAMYFDVLGLCGCGNPCAVHEMLLDCIKAKSCDDVAKIVAASPGLVAEFIRHFLDSKGLMDHGGSVYGAWLTPLGKQFVEIGVTL